MEFLKKVCCCPVDDDEKQADPASTQLGTNQPLKDNTMQVNQDLAASWKPAEDHKKFPDAKYDNYRRFHAVTASPYVLPADVNEQERLVLQHKLVTFGFGSLFHLPIEQRLKDGNIKVLDSGCGPGAWAKQVAKTYPKATVVGVDMAKTILPEDNGGLENLSFVVGNILEGYPFEDNTFDAVYQRYLVAGITKDKWVDLIKELKRITKPGGYIELVELRMNYFQTGPEFLKITTPLNKSLEARGFDLDVGMNLEKYMKEAGVEVIDEAIHSAPIGWGGHFGELQKLNAQIAWTGFKPFLTKVLSLSDDEYNAAVKRGLDECKEYQTFFNIYALVGMVSK